MPMLPNAMSAVDSSRRATMDTVIDEHFRAEAAVDIDAILATYADQVEFDAIGNTEGVLHDKLAIGVFYNMLFGELADVRIHSVRRWYGVDHNTASATEPPARTEQHPRVPGDPVVLVVPARLQGQLSVLVNEWQRTMIAAPLSDPSDRPTQTIRGCLPLDQRVVSD
jgi:hypothetical protein